MRAGQLRYIAELQNPGSTGDAYSSAGGYTTTATGLRCDVRDLNGREVRAARQEGSEVTVEIFCRARADITAASRLIVDGTTYEVLAPLRTGPRRQDMRLQCKVVS